MKKMLLFLLFGTLITLSPVNGYEKVYRGNIKACVSKYPGCRCNHHNKRCHLSCTAINQYYTYSPVSAY